VPQLAGAGHVGIGRGVLDITLYRDDLSEIGPRPMVRPTRMECDIRGRTVVLVDDVLFTGRTVRAGLEAIADFGRPRAVRLAVLVDRGGRELPIQPDHVSLVERHVPLTHRVKVKLAERDGVDEVVIEPR
jgi:pyrimidine operon attenuation protein/uracil phosphoribosyltransferase